MSDTPAASLNVPVSAAPTPEFKPWLRWFAPVALATLVLDLLSKSLCFAYPETVEQLSWVRLAYNQGVAWSLFAEHPWLVVGLTVVLIPVLALVWWKQYRHIGGWENFAFGLVLGGALGNAFDRIGMAAGQLHGVRDFLHVDLGFAPFHPWPTFNIADSGICIGFALLVLRSFCAPTVSQPVTPSATPPAASSQV